MVAGGMDEHINRHTPKYGQSEDKPQSEQTYLRDVEKYDANIYYHPHHLTFSLQIVIFFGHHLFICLAKSDMFSNISPQSSQEGIFSPMLVSYFSTSLKYVCSLWGLSSD
jgi:hypothetical protein